MEKKLSKINYFSIIWALFLIVFAVSCAVITKSTYLRYSLFVWLCFMLLLSFLSYRTKKDVEEKTPEKFSTLRVLLFRVFMIAVIIVISLPAVNPPFLNIIARTTTTGVIGFTLTLVGLLFAAWSRLILSSNWSALVVLKKDHELINKGPYSLVRHPMYTGVLAAIWGLFMFFGGLVHLIFFIVLTFGFIKKMNAEEAVLSENLKGYKEYKEKTKKIIPFLY